MRNLSSLFAFLSISMIPFAALPAHAESAATTRLTARTAELQKDVVELTPGVYVAVGFSPANSSMVVGTDGVVIIDTGLSASHATEIWKEFRKRTDKPVVAVIYTHAHGDHMIGTKVFVGEQDFEIWARSNFDAENRAFSASGVTINRSRGSRQAGFQLPDELRINNGVALAMRPDAGSNAFAAEASSHLPPNRTFSVDRKKLELAGVRIELVAAPGETSDQLYVWLPEKKVLFAGDNFYQSWPNLYAIRGTPYRDVRAWADSVDKMLDEKPEYLVGGHTRPLSGAATVASALTNYRDAIRFVFDRTVEGMNQGLTPDELVDFVRLPEKFRKLDYLGEYYGNVEWAVRSIFAGHLGWFDGNPTNLFPLAPQEEAKRIARLAGGAASLRETARKALSSRDYQWAAQLSDYLLALDPEDGDAMRLKADALTALAQELLTSTGRNYYLTVAQDLRRRAGTAE